MDDLAALVVRVRSGDRAAAEALVASTQDWLFRLAYALLGDYHSAQDALQETFLACLPRLAQLRNPAAIKSWLARSLTRSCWRLKPRRRVVPLEAAREAVEPRGVEQTALGRQAVLELLAVLTPGEREAVVMRDVMDLTYEEMAEILEVPLGTVKSRLFAGRRRMERWLGAKP